VSFIADDNVKVGILELVLDHSQLSDRQNGTQCTISVNSFIRYLYASSYVLSRLSAPYLLVPDDHHRVDLSKRKIGDNRL